MINPGAGYGGYVKLTDITDKGKLTYKKINFLLKDNCIYANGTVLQGLRIIENIAYITGIHYTSWENATQIRSMERIEPSLIDPFVYISEPGKMQNWPEEAIKKELGAMKANTEIKISVKVPTNIVWIKCSREVSHYAISGIIASNEINKLEIQRRKA